MTADLAAALKPQEDRAPKWLAYWCPTILLHVLYPDSRKVGFGWWVFIVATYAAFVLKGADGKPMLDASTWLLVVTASTALIGGGSIADDAHDREMAKIAAAAAGGGNAPPA